jgi:hypothetical protein
MVAAYWASKLSYMNRVISEVLPTDCSPRKTSLNLRSGFEKVESAMVRGRKGGEGGRGDVCFEGGWDWNGDGEAGNPRRRNPLANEHFLVKWALSKKIN